jgi:citronellyl-CoA dehydrogenase
MSNLHIIPVIEPLTEVLQSTIEYTRGRRAFGRAIIDNQYVHYTLAELHCELEVIIYLTATTSTILVGGALSTLSRMHRTSTRSRCDRVGEYRKAQG